MPKTIDLSKFCWKWEATRYEISKPWSKNGYTYATDSMIFVRLDGVHADPPTGIVPKDFADIALKPKKWSDLPEVPPCKQCGCGMPESVVCWDCGGKKEVDCDLCGGDGTVTCEYYHEHDCPDCDCGKVRCNTCDGEGVLHGQDRCGECPLVDCGDVKISSRYARLIAELPNVQWAPLAVQGKDHDGAAFRFDGGVGVCMGVS